MKKLILAVAVALMVLATQAFAGSFGNMMIGAKGGLNINNFYGDSDLETGTRTDFLVGGFVEIPINQMISFQPEIFYTRKGGEVGHEEPLEKWRLQYIEIPMLFKAYLPMEMGKPFVCFGPEVAFRTSGTWEWEQDGETFEEDVEDISNTDVGLIFGAGVGFPVMNHMLSLEARYDLGLSTLDETEEPWEVKNSVISVLVGIGF